MKRTIDDATNADWRELDKAIQRANADMPREWSPMQGVAAVATGWVPASIVHEQLVRWNRERQDWEESGRVLAPMDPAASERCWARAELMRRMITQLEARMARESKRQPAPNRCE